MTLTRRALLAGARKTHFVSLVVHCRPECLAEARRAIAALPDTEVPASDERAKLVALLELRDESALLERIAAIEAAPGVLSASLAFHQVEAV